MTVDTSDLTWCIQLDIEHMKVIDVEYLMRRVTELGRYSAGTTKDDHIQLCYEDGEIKLYLLDVSDEDMPAVLGAIRQYKADVVQIGHYALGSAFERTNHAFSPDILATYWENAIGEDGESIDAWEKWKIDSGFIDFVEEVYSNDD